MAIGKLADGRAKPWYDRWYVRGPDGNDKAVTRTFRTQAEAREHERTRIRQGAPSKAQEFKVSPRITVEALSARFLAYAETKRGNTFLGYKSNLTQHINPVFGAWAVVDVNRASVLDWLVVKMKEPVIRNGKVLRAKRSPASVRSMLSTFSALCGYAVVQGIFPHNPLDRLAKDLGLNPDKKLRVKGKTLKAEEADVFLTTAETVAPAFYLLFLLMFRTGVRPAEALALKRTDVDVDAGTLSVERAKSRDVNGAWTIAPPKSPKAVRKIRLSDELATALAPHVGKGGLRVVQAGKGAASHWLFPNDQDPATYTNPADGTRSIFALEKAMKRVLKAAGLPMRAFGFTPHSGRHTTATLLLDAGEPLTRVQDLLGHESIRLTSDTYGGERTGMADVNKLDRNNRNRAAGDS